MARAFHVPISAQLNQMLGTIVDAIDYNNGNTTDTTFVSFNGN